MQTPKDGIFYASLDKSKARINRSQLVKSWGIDRFDHSDLDTTQLDLGNLTWADFITRHVREGETNLNLKSMMFLQHPMILVRKLGLFTNYAEFISIDAILL